MQKELTYYRIDENNEEQFLIEESERLYSLPRYSYADYLLFKVEERLEIIKGRLLKMSAPNRIHQEISAFVHNTIFNFLKNRNCRAYTAPFDVRLPVKNNKKDNEIFTVVQPDIVVVCDLTKLDDRGCCGAPELVIEILSPGNSKKEIQLKFDVYEEAGVLEYWIVYPESKTILVYLLENGKYKGLKPVSYEGFVVSKVLEGIEIDVEEVFSQ
jgi:Uma2 family endonuclease